MLLRLGQNLKKLLTPDPAAVTVTNDSREGGFRYVGNSSSSSSPSKRPTSADWRSLSKLSRSVSTGGHDEFTQHNSSSTSASQFKKSKNHKQAMETAIGLRSSDIRLQPDLPRTINRQDDESSAVIKAQLSAITWDHSLEGGRSLSTLGNHDLGTNSFVSSTYDPDDIQGVIYEREKHFFNEISKNPQLRDQHPLMHLIASQQKLKLADKQSGIQTTKSANEKESIFGTKYGKQGDDNFDKYGAYQKEIPYTINGQVILPSTFMKQKELEKTVMLEKKKERHLRKLQALRFDTNATGSVDTTDSILHGTISSSAQSHLDFLNNALRGVEKDIGKPKGNASVKTSDAGNDGGNSHRSYDNDNMSLNSKSAELLNDISFLTLGTTTNTNNLIRLSPSLNDVEVDVDDDQSVSISGSVASKTASSLRSIMANRNLKLEVLDSNS